jgi:putative polyhydroxyalkanoate system protein
MPSEDDARAHADEAQDAEPPRTRVLRLRRGTGRRELRGASIMTIRIRRRHGMRQEDARKRVETVAEELGRKLSADYHWESDDLVFRRAGATGRIRVDAEHVDIQVQLGLLLRPLEDGIRRDIESRLDRALEGP